ncbi:MAG: hypothetical protein ACKVT1_08950 [Dehalococcoidia bacterium]
MGLFDKIRAKLAADSEGRKSAESDKLAYRAALELIDWVDADAAALADLRSLRAGATVDAKELRELQVAAFRRCAEQALIDDILSASEEMRLVELGEILGIGAEALQGELHDIRDRLIVAMVNDGRLPELDPAEAGILLKRGETAHGTTEATLLKGVTIREFQAGSQGVSFRIAKGVRYHVGRTKGKVVVTGHDLVVDDVGTLTVTSRRVVFSGAKRALEFDYRKLLDMDVFSDGIRLAVSNRQTPSTFRVASGDVIAAMINGAAQRIPE